MKSRSTDLKEFSDTYKFANALTEVRFRLQQLCEKVDNIVVAVSSEAMTDSLTVCDYTKTADKKTPGLKSIADQLGEHLKPLDRKLF